MTTTLIPPTESLAVRPWPDPVIDALGHDPRSAYVEQFWLGILGPPSCAFQQGQSDASPSRGRDRRWRTRA